MSWPTMPLRHALVLMTKGCTPPYSDHAATPVITQAVVQDGRLDEEAMLMTSEPAIRLAIAEPGDTLVTTLGNGTLGRVAIATREGCAVDSNVLILRPDRSKVEPRWLYYSLRARRPELVSKLPIGATNQLAIRPSDIGRLSISTPPLPEQRAIANSLDVETARMDLLLERKGAMLRLLDEHWAALRFGATLGARDHDHWVQLRHIADVQAGAAFPHTHQGAHEGAIPYVKVGDLSRVDDRERITGAANYVSPEIAALLGSPILPSGTIVLPKIGAALLTNRRAVLSEPSCLDQNVMGVTVQQGSPDFVFYCLASMDLGALSTPGPVPLLNEAAARAIKLPWPPPGVQVGVSRRLNQWARRNGAIRRRLAAQQELLRERRRAIIAAAVAEQYDAEEGALECDTA